MSGFLDNFKEGTGIKLAAQGAQVAWATGQAIHSNIKYREKMTDIENFQRQEIINPFQNLSNPYANLQVATKAAEMQAEQTDIALANTLDNLRETGAGGATALAQAALRSKQGVSASIQQQETQNQKLQAQGQLQVDIAKGKGESWRTGMQERREIQELDRMQGQADLLRAQQLYSTQAAVAGLGAMGETLGSGMLPPQIPETSQTTEQSTSQANQRAAANAQQAMQDILRNGNAGQVGYNSLNTYGRFDPSSYKATGLGTAWDNLGLNSMIQERDSLDPSDANYQIDLENINKLITDTRSKL